MDLLAGVERALDEHDDAVDAVSELVARLHDVADEPLAALCRRLHDARAFEALGLVADAAIASGRTGRFWAALGAAAIQSGERSRASLRLRWWPSPLSCR